MDQLVELFQTFQAYSKENPVVSGIVGLWGAGVATYLLRDIPMRVWSFIKNQSQSTLTFQNQDGSLYDAALVWIDSQKASKLNRNYKSEPVFGSRSYLSNEGYPDCEHPRPFKDKLDKTKAITLGYGMNIYYRGWVPFFVYREELKTENSKQVKEKLTISIITRSRKTLEEVNREIISFIPVESKDDDFLRVYDFDDDSCSPYDHDYERVPKRNINSVVIDNKNKELIIKTIDDFIKSKDIYRKYGRPYQLGILLSGPPGTGKTSLISALAAKYNRSICNLNLSRATDVNIKDGMKPRDNSFLVIEDIDAHGVDLNRAKESEKIVPKLNIATLLNSMDGTGSAPDRIMIATSNHPERLDPAITRSGRFDLIVELGYTTEEMLIDYINVFDKSIVLPEGYKIKENTPMCDIQDLAFSHRDNLYKVIEELRCGN